jgi:hypothetical protein
LEGPIGALPSRTTIFGHVDGSTPPPPQTIANLNSADRESLTIANPKFMLWIVQDQNSFECYHILLSKTVLSQVIGCSTSHEIWGALEKMYCSESRARVMHIHHRLATTNKGSTSVTIYFHKIKSLANSLTAEEL